jgi:hypothetical protein
MKEFEKELAVLKGRVDGLEARVGELEATQFSTTTKLKGLATFVMGANAFGGSNDTISDAYKATQGAASFAYDVRLMFDTSFTGSDLLRTTLRAGNFADSAWGSGLNTLEVAFQEDCGKGGDCGDVVAINRLFYQFPVGDKVTVTVGGRVRQDDMLAMWPSVYPADTVLDVFTYAGAPGTYSLNLGAGAGVWYQDNGFSASINYVSANADMSNPNIGGIGTDGAEQTFTAQLGYAADQWGAAVAYNYGNGVGPASGTPVVASFAAPSNNSVAISAYWQPEESGFIPSVSAGWGITGYSQDDRAFDFDGTTSNSWYVGLQWDDAFIDGNALGMAVGQPTFLTACESDLCGDSPKDGNWAWEWWYKFQVTDNISVTPALYYLSNPLGHAGWLLNEKKNDSAPLNNFGGIIKTTFKF